MQHLQKNRGYILQANYLSLSSPRLSSSPISHLPYTLPSSVSSKSFACHSYENCRGVYQQFPFWNPPLATRHSPLSFPPVIPGIFRPDLVGECNRGELATRNSSFATISSPLDSSSFFSHPCALFCINEKLNSFVFKQFRTLCKKPPGVGGPVINSLFRAPANLSARRLRRSCRGASAFLFFRPSSRRLPREGRGGKFLAFFQLQIEDPELLGTFSFRPWTSCQERPLPAACRRFWPERPSGVSWGLRIQRAGRGRRFRAAAPRPGCPEVRGEIRKEPA